MRIAIAEITRDPRCQSRVEMHEDVVADYAEAMKDGATFPPVTVFHDGDTYWLADGFHRLAAAELAGVESLPADIREGGIRNAELHSVSANATHGKQRTRADKRRAVEMLLADEEWKSWTDNAIATQCRVSHHFVAKVRESLGTNQVTQERTYRDRWGNVSTMDVSNIGKGDHAVETVKVEAIDTGDIAVTIRQLIIHHGRERVASVALATLEEMEHQGWQ